MLAAVIGGALLAAGLGTALVAVPKPSTGMENQTFGLMTSLPIYRAPKASVAEALAAQDGAGQPHWLRQVVEARNSLDPVDLLDSASLAKLDYLLLVQPRALTPGENVALDEWVRAGGQVLLVADPMLITEPRFALGDPRNPQAISVTGPIHARWGLELEPGIDGDARESLADLGAARLPVVLGGSFAKRPPEGGDPADCDLYAERVVAVCTIGEGRAVLVADATMFERASPSSDAEAAFWALLGMMRDGPEG